MALIKCEECGKNGNMIFEKLMKILKYGWMYVIVAVFIISMSGCTEEKKAEAPAAEECQTEAANPDASDAATPADAVEGSESESDAAESEADPGVRDIPVKGAK